MRLGSRWNLAMKSPSSQSVSKSVNLSNGHQNGYLKGLDRQKSRSNKAGRIDTTNFHPPNNGKLSAIAIIVFNLISAKHSFQFKYSILK